MSSPNLKNNSVRRRHAKLAAKHARDAERKARGWKPATVGVSRMQRKPKVTVRGRSSAAVLAALAAVGVTEKP